MERVREVGAEPGGVGVMQGTAVLLSESNAGVVSSPRASLGT